jgi:ATP-binding cassette subfamily B protein
VSVDAGRRPPRVGAYEFDSETDPGGFEPVTTHLRYQPPRRTIDPDQSKGWIKRFLPIVYAHWFAFAMALSMALIGIITRVMIPRWVGYAINEALVRPKATRVPLSHFVIMLGVLTAVGFVAGAISRYFLFRCAYSLDYDLRVLMYRHLSRMSFSFYDRVESGQLISRANSDIRSVQIFLAFGPYFMVQFALFAIAVFYMVQINLLLTLLALVTIPFVYRIGVTMRSWMFPLSWLTMARTAEIATIVDENINGVRVVKSFAAEDEQIGKLAASADRLRWVAVKTMWARARYGPLMENLTRLGEASIILYGGILVIDRRIGPGDLLVFLTYLALLQAPFRMLGFILMMQQRASASAQRIYEVLDEVADIRDAPGAVDLVEARGDVEFRHVSFTYHDGPQVFDGLDLTVPAGQTIAIVGRTGSGKTTLAELVPRFYDVDAGAVLVDGHDVRDLTVASLRSHVGFCFDEPFLFSASIRDNIAYGRPQATMEEIVDAARRAGAHDFILGLSNGYDTVVGERGYTLSGGQRQRVAIARTIVENPAILILDDATSAIDVKIEMQIHDALREVMSGRTTLIIAHRLSTISLAQRVVLLEGGRVVADGSHLELMATEPRYARVLAHLEEDDEAKAESVEAEVHAHHIVVPDDGPVGDPGDEPLLEGSAFVVTPEPLDLGDGAHFFPTNGGGTNGGEA